MAQVRPLIAGNWKMNGLRASKSEFDAIVAGVHVVAGRADLLICPPATWLATFAGNSVSGVALGAQDCHAEVSGAHTGDLSAEMLADAGARAIIVGHSERRADHGETDGSVHAKAVACWRAGVMAIVCVGETQAERDRGQALSIVGGQLDGSVPDGATAENTIVAYEPVWAIGTGRTPTVADVAEMHALIRQRLVARLGSPADAMRILYGGSVKPANAAELLAIANVNGALVGGASLKAADFLGIAAACR